MSETQPTTTDNTTDQSAPPLSSECADTYRRIRWTGMDLLARREHSRRELSQKLLQRYPDDPSLIEVVLDELEAELLQSDSRFTEAYVAMRARKGYGPEHIRQELRERGVESLLAESELERAVYDWYQLALVALNKKFSGPATTPRERARQMRFMQYRGFTHDQIRAALKTFEGGC